MGKREERRSLAKWLDSIPHLFGKIIVYVCIACGIFFSFYAMRIKSHTGHDASTELIAILGFFGGELLFMVLRNILNNKKGNDHGDV